MTLGGITKAIALFFVAVCGAVFGGWISIDNRPVKFMSRKVLTPYVRPGDPVEIELVNYRERRCPQVVYNTVNYPNMKRDPQNTSLPDNFGKIGSDKYVKEIPTKAKTNMGKATIYTYVESMCNPWEYWYPKVSGPWIDYFEFAEVTVKLTPEEVPNSLDTQ